MAAGSLTVVGTGIQFARDLTPASLACIKRADKVLMLTSDFVTRTLLQRLNPASESLNRFYKPKQNRARIYRAIVERIVQHVRRGLAVCVVSYGHPGYLVDATRLALSIVRAEGYPARMLPAVSSFDCLLADLGFDPGQLGCQTYEATGFLLQRRRLDTTCPLVIFQPALAGDLTHKRRYGRNGLRNLARRLIEGYGPGHEVVVYEAAQYPCADPVIERVPLRELPAVRMSAFSTLFVPPARAPTIDLAACRGLGISATALTAAP